MMNGFVKSGKAKVGVVMSAVFRVSNASPVAAVHWNGLFLRNNSVSGRAIVPN